METKDGSVALGREAMRTRFEVLLPAGRDPGFLRAAGEEALDEISRVEADLSIYRTDSIFFQLNAEAAERPVQVDPAIFGLLLRAQELSRRLDGAFDLTVGALVRHYRGEAIGLDEARLLVGLADKVELDPERFTVAFSRLGVRLDAGALGKGYALERAAALLREAGIERALLHGGTSSVCALGTPPGQAAWMVAIAHPGAPGQALARARLVDAGLSVSASGGRSFERDGKRVGHVIDPRTGRPVEATTLAAAITASPTEAEAISTALLVLGAAGLDRIEQEFPGASALVASPRAGGELAVDLLGDGFSEP